MNTAPKYVDEKFLAEHTPFERVTWQHRRRKGLAPRYYKVGRKCLYDWHEVEEWIRSHARGARRRGRQKRRARAGNPGSKASSTG